MKVPPSIQRPRNTFPHQPHRRTPRNTPHGRIQNAGPGNLCIPHSEQPFRHEKKLRSVDYHTNGLLAI